jgi:RNA polymerase sigma-70 factor (ECF subfamily)
MTDTIKITADTAILERCETRCESATQAKGGKHMTDTIKDTAILELYETRCESAISETQKQYGAYCMSIAMNILQNREDAEECVNDTFLKAWNAIPPERPNVFAAFIGRITRNLSLDRYKSNKTAKRGGGETALLLSEMKTCIPDARNVEREVESKDLTRIIEDYLDTIREEDSAFFVRRYWHGEAVAQIAAKLGVSVSRINTSLHRTRKKLKTYLSERGVSYEN